MASTMYIDEFDVSTNEWHVGLEVILTFNIGCFSYNCKGCRGIGLNWGLAEEKDAACGHAPRSFHEFGHETISLGCGDEIRIEKRRTVTQDDVDRIESGAEKCVAFISDGLRGQCCVGKTVYTVEPPNPAHGRLVNIDHPASVEHGARFEVRAAVKNTGGSTGHFYLMLYQNGHEDYEYELGDIAAGSTSSTVSLPATAPGTGSSTSIELKCIRTT